MRRRKNEIKYITGASNRFVPDSGITRCLDIQAGLLISACDRKPSICISLGNSNTSDEKSSSLDKVSNAAITLSNTCIMYSNKRRQLLRQQ